jgi:hypothetical protein
MKTFRKNVDLTSDTVAILQIEATLSQFGTLKPFLESLLESHAAKCRKARPKVYEAIIERKVQKLIKPKTRRKNR